MALSAETGWLAAMLIDASFLLLVAVVIFWDASAMQSTTTYGMGPQAMPYVIATGMVLLAIGNSGWRGAATFPSAKASSRRRSFSFSAAWPR